MIRQIATAPPASPKAAPVAGAAPVSTRLASLDAYRGLVMFLMMAEVLELALVGLVGLASGLALGWLGICPVVKRIWTPSWVLFSGGWCFLLMAGFYLLMDLWGRKRWAFPLVVIGMNSIAAYCMAHLFGSFISRSLRTHLGSDACKLFGQVYEPMAHGALVLLVMWLLLLWMHRRKIFLRI